VTKEEFAKKLRERLDLLEEKEIDDIIEEYLGYIEEKIGNGATEEEAIKDFGDIDELARELLKAYKINVKHQPKEKNILSTIADTFILWMDRFVKVFSNKSSSEVLKLIIEMGIILLIISLCKIPFYILEEIGYDMFNIFQSQFARGLFKIWKFLLELIYLVSAVVLFAKIFEKRYLNHEVEKTLPLPKKRKETIEKETKIEKVITEKTPKNGLIDLLSSLCIWFIKFIAFWILFGIGCYILGLAICVGICVYFLIRGVVFYGIYLAIFMLLVLGILAFIVLFNFIANKKNNLNFLLIAFLSSFIILGISFSAASLEITEFEWINETPDSYQKETITELIPMKDDYYIDHFVNFVVDESLEKEIKFEYIYFPEHYKIKPNIKISNNSIYVNYSFMNHSWNVRILEDIIDNLKNHKLYNYDLSPRITVYTSSANIERLKENRRLSYDQKKYQNNRYRFCQEIIYEEEKDSELYHYCHKFLELPEEALEDLD
jgi:uncharacterized membrane protein